MKVHRKRYLDSIDRVIRTVTFNELVRPGTLDKLADLRLLSDGELNRLRQLYPFAKLKARAIFSTWTPEPKKLRAMIQDLRALNDQLEASRFSAQGVPPGRFGRPYVHSPQHRRELEAIEKPFFKKWGDLYRALVAGVPTERRQAGMSEEEAFFDPFTPPSVCVRVGFDMPEPLLLELIREVRRFERFPARVSLRGRPSGSNSLSFPQQLVAVECFRRGLSDEKTAREIDPEGCQSQRKESLVVMVKRFRLKLGIRRK